MSDTAIADEVIHLANAAMVDQDWTEALRLWEFVVSHIDPNADANGDQRRIARLHIEGFTDEL